MRFGRHVQVGICPCLPISRLPTSLAALTHLTHPAYLIAVVSLHVNSHPPTYLSVGRCRRWHLFVPPHCLQRGRGHVHAAVGHATERGPGGHVQVGRGRKGRGGGGGGWLCVGLGRDAHARSAWQQGHRSQRVSCVTSASCCRRRRHPQHQPHPPSCPRPAAASPSPLPLPARASLPSGPAATTTAHYSLLLGFMYVCLCESNTAQL